MQITSTQHLKDTDKLIELKNKDKLFIFSRKPQNRKTFNSQRHQLTSFWFGKSTQHISPKQGDVPILRVVKAYVNLKFVRIVFLSNYILTKGKIYKIITIYYCELTVRSEFQTHERKEWQAQTQ